MSGSLSTYLEMAILEHVFGGPLYPQPHAIYIALFTVAPTMDGGGTEVSAASYTRMPVTFNAPAGSPPVVSNPNAIQWPTASTDWGVVFAGGLYDNQTIGAGNFLGSATMVSAVDGVTPAPIDIKAGMVFRLPPMGLVVGFVLPPPSTVPFTAPTRRSLAMRPIPGQVLDGAGIGRMGLVMVPPA